MPLAFLRLNRLQRKTLAVILVLVVVPMLVAGGLAAAWVSANFERRLEQWISQAARAGQSWLDANQNDAVLLARILADDPSYVASLRTQPGGVIPPNILRIAEDLGISLIQVYTRNHELIYSSIPVDIKPHWDPGQTEAVFRVGRGANSMLAAVGITPVPRHGVPQYYLVLGSLLDRTFTEELAKLTGLTTRLYYREGDRYLDVFSRPGRTVALRYPSSDAWTQLRQNHKPYYSLAAEHNQYRGLYLPIVDSTGHVEAILFGGIEKRGAEEVLTSRLAMFLAITLLGVVVGGLTGVVLSRLLFRPIEQLRRAVLQLTGQNFYAMVPVTSDDELGDLARAFNAMATSLRQARDSEQQQFRRDKLAAMGKLSGALAHEIRNPIGVINTAAAILEKPDSSPEKRGELLRMIREESQRVSNLVQEFLQLSRYRQPAFSLIDPVIPLEKALSAALAGRSDITVQRRLHHGQAHILADAALVQQAWGNILLNAVQAIGPGPGRIALISRIEDAAVWLSAEDSGPGIPPDVMPRLFEPFFTTKDKGTGLGLSMAYTLVEANGGRLEVLEPEGSGARFGMRFPAHDKVES